MFVEQIDAIDEMLMIEPGRPARITGITALHVRHIAERLTSKMRCHASSSTRAAGRVPGADADVVVQDVEGAVRRRWPPRDRRARLAIGDVGPVRDGLAARVADHRDRLLGRGEVAVDHDHLAPSRANMMAVARPLPIVSPGVCPPPTTTATRPSKRPDMVAFLPALMPGRSDATAPSSRRSRTLAAAITGRGYRTVYNLWTTIVRASRRW